MSFSEEKLLTLLLHDQLKRGRVDKTSVGPLARDLVGTRWRAGMAPSTSSPTTASAAAPATAHRRDDDTYGHDQEHGPQPRGTRLSAA
jgi:hypothetical protein